ncbi:MAG: OmpA family protein [Lachnospiraceae bacterium]|nr:OmpA family protein [Lachnospiraceae bacterium]
MKKNHDHEEHMDESWLIPYADLLTLLLALFIVLFATSTADEKLMTAMKMAFYEEYTGIMPEPETGDPGVGGIDDGPSMITGDPLPITETGDEADEEANEEADAENEEGETPAETVAKLTAVLQEEFSNYVTANGLEEEMRIESRPEGLLITLTSDVWFPSGSAEINDSQKDVAIQIAKMIARVQDESDVMLSVIVSGHTDNVPISGSEYPNNWRLSLMRAANFMEALMNNSTLGPSNFSASGYGEYSPITTNDTEEGRQRNRRVEVLISPKVPAY